MESTPSTSNTITNYQLDIEELEKLIQQSTRPNIKRQLEENKKNLVILLEEEKKKIEKPIQQEKQSQVVKDINETLQFVTVSKYALDSGDKFVKIYLTDGFANLKDHPKENIFTKFNKKSFEVQILNWNKKNFKFGSNNLNKEIDPEGSYVKQGANGLTIFLKKSKSTDHWDALEYKKPLVSEKPEKGDMNKDPNAGLMDMMREMYENGDPEMKRIIAESWTKSRTEGDKGKFDI